MAPEVLKSKQYTLKADVFSFGIILWEILMQRLPERDMEIIVAGIPPEVPDELRSQYPEYILLFESCCRKNPTKRPSFDQIVIELNKIKNKSF